MDALKVVPQIFFDAIGRVVPGSVAIVMYFLFFDPKWNQWKACVDGALAGRSVDQESPVGFVVLSLLMSAYVAGHLLSPLTKAVQRIGERIPAPLKKHDSAAYAWLRMHKPDAGAHCAKLRAEFTMYNSLAAVSVVFAAALSALKQPVPWIDVAVLILAAVLMAYRGRETAGTFGEAIDQFRAASKDPPPLLPKQPAGDFV
jgi:hypothetical protein